MPLTSAERQARYRQKHPEKVRKYKESHRQMYCDLAKIYRNKRKDYYKDRHLHRVTFKDERHIQPIKPRIGKCSECGKEGYTHIHHDKYDKNDHLAYTRELCPRCHTTYHREKERLSHGTDRS